MRRDAEIAARPRSSVIRRRRFSNSTFLGIRPMLLSAATYCQDAGQTQIRAGGEGVGRGCCGGVLLGTTLHATNLINFCNLFFKKKKSLPFSCWKRQKTAVNLPDGGFHSRSEATSDGQEPFFLMSPSILDKNGRFHRFWTGSCSLSSQKKEYKKCFRWYQPNGFPSGGSRPFCLTRRRPLQSAAHLVSGGFPGGHAVEYSGAPEPTR